MDYNVQKHWYGSLKNIFQTHTHRYTNTHFLQKVSVIAPGWWPTGVNLKTHTHPHTHTQAVETAGQAKPVSVKATSSFEDRGSL